MRKCGDEARETRKEKKLIRRWMRDRSCNPHKKPRLAQKESRQGRKQGIKTSGVLLSSTPTHNEVLIKSCLEEEEKKNEGGEQKERQEHHRDGGNRQMVAEQILCAKKRAPALNNLQRIKESLLKKR